MAKNRYKTKKVKDTFIEKAEARNMTFNEWVTELDLLATIESTSEEKIQYDKMQKLESLVASLVKIRESDKFAMDMQSKKIDQLIQAQESTQKNFDKLIQMFGADINFIQALKKEVTK